MKPHSTASIGLILLGAQGVEHTETTNLNPTGEALDARVVRHMEPKEMGLLLYVVD